MLQLLVREVLGEHPLHGEVHAPAFEVAAPLRNVYNRQRRRSGGRGAQGCEVSTPVTDHAHGVAGAGAGAGSSDDG